MLDKYAKSIAENALPIAAGVALLVFALYYTSRRVVADVGSAAGGLVSGNNAVTEGTVYAGRGVAGTLGSTVNRVLGGLPQAVGESVAAWFVPNVPATGNLFYNVRMPDGTKAAIIDSAVDRRGYFTRDGVRYRLGISREGNRFAVKV